MLAMLAKLTLPIFAILAHLTIACSPTNAGGLLGDFLGAVGDSTGITPLEDLGRELDEVHRNVKENIPPYKYIEEKTSKAVRNALLAQCNMIYQGITTAVIADCDNWPGRLSDRDLIEEAKNLLIDNEILAASEFENIQIRWCPLRKGSGIAPDRGRIYLNSNSKNDDIENIAALLAHEMIHARQYRSMGSDKFKCEYSRHFVACNGCQDDRHPMERDAYTFEESVYEKIEPWSWRMCNETLNRIWVAYSYIKSGEWITKGWRVLERGECSMMVRRLEGRYVYFRAETRDGGTISGNYNICVHPRKRFSLIGENCPNGYDTAKATEVSIRRGRQKTVRLRDQ
jgi:uncharacterized membrane protein